MITYIYGPQAAGKTTLARRLATELTGSDRGVKCITGKMPPFWPRELPDVIVWEEAPEKTVQQALERDPWLFDRKGEAPVEAPRPSLVIVSNEPPPEWLFQHWPRIIHLPKGAYL